LMKNDEFTNDEEKNITTKITKGAKGIKNLHFTVYSRRQEKMQNYK